VAKNNDNDNASKVVTKTKKTAKKSQSKSKVTTQQQMERAIKMVESIVSSKLSGDEFFLTPINAEESSNKQIKKPSKNKATQTAETKIITVPLIPLRDIVIFPNSINPLFIGRPKSVAAVEHATKGDRMVLLCTQKNSSTDDIAIKNMLDFGSLATIIQRVQLPDDTLKVLVDANERAKVLSFKDNGKYIEAKIEIQTVSNKPDVAIEALMRNIIDNIKEYSTISKRINQDAISTIVDIKEPSTFADMVASYLPIDYKIKQQILELIDTAKRLEKILTIIIEELDILKTEKDIQDRIKKQMDKNNREYYLHEQIKAIRKELGDGDYAGDAINKYQEQMKTKVMSKEATEKAEEEMKRLNSASSSSAETIRSYLDWLLYMPWNTATDCKPTISAAKHILNTSHYGLEKVKDIIIEYIAVQINKKKTKSTILCLYGPPGVGKTSLVKAIAEAMGRKYAKIALGGVHDEAEIRGHRRTYVGSMPGRLIQTMKRVGVSNPVILLDEIDKMTSDYRGDPQAALLEALDSEQNKEFQDHFLEVGYDLSNVVFIATANSLTMQRPLLDRLEIVNVPSYLEQDKFEICKHYIISKQLDNVGITSKHLEITDDSIKDIIKFYTRESGVREVERLIGKLARKVLVDIMKNLDQPEDAAKPNEGKAKKVKKDVTVQEETKIMEIEKLHNIPQVTVIPSDLQKYLGVKKYTHSETEKQNLVGITNGLAYTEVGGDMLLIEAVKIPNGKGSFKITGKLGDVMKESAQAAMSYISSNCNKYGIKKEDIFKHDAHIHVPEGATPKDGPSAGVTMCTSIVSLFTGIPVRHDVAMTGETTLRGRVLPIGGLREKLVSALRSGIKIVLIPSENKKDLEDVPEYVKENLQIILCENVDDVLKVALQSQPTPLINDTYSYKDDDKKAATME
jgi:ATP-dependent Lon protease